MSRPTSLAPGARAWWLVLAAGLVGLAVYFWLPESSQDLAYNAWTTLAAGLVVVGVILHRPAAPAPWLVLAAGLGLAALGDWTWTLLAAVGEEPFPSVADLFYLSGMGLIGVSVWIDSRGRLAGGDRAAAIDSLILACGFALLTWFLVMKPITAAGSGSVVETAVALAYPSIDIALLAVAARLVLASGLRAPSYRLLALALCGYLVADISFAWLDLNGAYAVGDPVDAGWLLGALGFALAALHPSMRRVAEPITHEAGRLTLRRVTALAAASLMAPLLLLVQAWQGTPIDALVIAAASIALFLLVIGRLVTVLVDLRRAFQQREVLEAELRRQATQDHLTGLANRALFTQRLAEVVARTDERVGLIFLDLDDFKRVNDSFGHAAGDAVLREVAARIAPLIRPADTAARVGGDEFAIVLREDPALTAVMSVAERLITALRRPYVIAGTEVPLGASAGLTVGVAGDATPESLMREADIAMYRAKAAGKGSFAVFDPTVDAEPSSPPVESVRRPTAYGAAAGATSAGAAA